MSAGPFRFRLERVREMRERAEDEAKEALGAALRRQDELTARLADAGTRLEEARTSKSATSGAACSVQAILAHQAFVERVEREQQAAELELSRHGAEVAARRAALQEAAREHQVLEKLRDKQAAAHRREAERVEARQIDELALAMHRRRSAA